MTNGAVITTTDYAGNYIYQNNALQMINQPEGYIEPNTAQTVFNYGYRLKDHLGNIRLTFVDFDHNGSIALSEITEENNYYPFGLKHQGYNNIVNSNTNAVASKFKYNGKELNDELGLDLYDYGARFYDAALGRWHTLDPLLELYKSWSPYNYAINSPIRFLDPNGMSVADQFWNNIIEDSDVERSGSEEWEEEKKKKEASQSQSVGNPVVIDNNSQALYHYLFGDGSPVEIGSKTISATLNHLDFKFGHYLIMRDKLNKPYFSVNMTWTVFHIGDTRVSYSINEKNRTITYTLFDGDSFSDPDFVDEYFLGELLGIQGCRSDGLSSNLERFGGKPYYYIPVKITFSY